MSGAEMNRRGVGEQRPHVGAARTLTAALGSTLLAMMPAFMLGGLAVFVRQDLGFDRAGVGTAVGVFFSASMIGSMHGGRFAQHLGPRRGVFVAATISGAALLSVALLARTWLHLALALFIAGIGNSIAQPAANFALVRGIPANRQGFAFGLKQSAVPLSSFLAGMAVPVVALTVGWRWAFAGGAVVAATLVTMLPADVGHTAPRKGRVKPQRPKRGEFRRFAIAGSLGSAGTTSVGSFLVEGLTDREIDVATAGIVLAVGSLGAVGMRMALGAYIDRRASLILHMNLVAITLLAAAVGFFAIALSPDGAVLIAAALLATVGASGWQGLFHFAIVRRSAVPATATGIVQAGMFSGGVFGPIIFGQVASRSFPVSWMLVGIAAVVSSWLVYRDAKQAAIGFV